MIDIQRDELLSISQLARRIPGPGRLGINPSTVFRWAFTGLRGHKLEVVRVAGRWLTTWQAFVDFNEALAGGKRVEPQRLPTPAKTKRVRDAKRVLQEAGII